MQFTVGARGAQSQDFGTMRRRGEESSISALSGGFVLTGSLVSCTTGSGVHFQRLLHRDGSVRFRTEMGHEHACRVPDGDGVSNSVTGRNRYDAKDFCLVPIAAVFVVPNGAPHKVPASQKLALERHFIDHAEPSIGLVRCWRYRVRHPATGDRAEPLASTRDVQMSIFSASSMASSTSMPRCRTVSRSSDARGKRVRYMHRECFKPASKRSAPRTSSLPREQSTKRETVMPQCLLRRRWPAQQRPSA